MSKGRQHSQHFLLREDDGTVRLRMRFSHEEASLFEEAAGDTPIMLWLHRALKGAAEREVRKLRARRADLPPPE
jgi:hypothetical protein